MRCSNCGSENPVGKKFCGNCGTQLGNSCPKCGVENPQSNKFCGDCGAVLAADSRTTASSNQLPSSAPTSEISIAAGPASGAIPDGERKTVTALFADIKGSMELMEDLDPEEARAIVDPALKLMIDAVHRYDGYIVQSTGDGIFALFGAPVAHEDHPLRALYAALRMQEEMRRYGDRMRMQGQTPIQVRIGVNTGEVVVRSIQTGAEHTEYTPIGHSTSLAARLQTLATPGSTIISVHTRAFAEGYFQLKALGQTKIKGVTEPVEVLEVIGLGPLRTRLQRAVGRGLSKFVGRQTEMEALRRALDQAKGGHGQIVAAIAEPGVGKSRLFHEFKAVAQSGTMVLEAFSVSHGKASVYLPVIDLLASYFKMATEDDERARREKVTGRVLALDRSLEDILPYLFVLLDIWQDGADPLAQLDPQLKRRRTLEAIKRLLVRESLGQPLIVIFEDLHWIDTETQALLNLLVESLATAPILLLVNYRPEYQHQWGSKTYYTQLRLDPLGKESANEMLEGLLGDAAELEPLKNLIIERTEGNPFFMEEMVQALLEQGVLVRDGAVKLVKSPEEIRVPSTVQAILASRIDRLPAPEKELLQTLAVLGREFQSGLIKRVADKSDDEVERILSNLQLAEFIYEQPAIPDIEYIFKHALTQEVACNSLLTQRRRMLHERTAQAIEALFAERLEDHLAELAHHYDRSGDVRKAVDYLRRAGLKAAHQVANSEAIAHFDRALELLKQLPHSVDRDRQELGLQLALGRPLASTRGSGAAEREPGLNRARELSEQLGDSVGLLDALLGLASFHLGRQEILKGRELMEMVLALAENVNAPALLAEAHGQMGVFQMAIGSFEAAREHMERALEVGLEVERALKIGVDVGPRTFRRAVLGLMSNVLVELGYSEAAQKKSQEFLSASRQLSDPDTLGPALFFDAWIRIKLRDTAMVMERAQELLSTSNETGSLFHRNHAKFFRGWALAAAGQGRNGITAMREAVSALVPVGGMRTLLFATLAEACESNGLCQEGLSAVAAGLEHAEQTGERHHQAELLKIKGDLIIMQDPADAGEAERHFRSAIDIAGQQAAKLSELRATISLARLLKSQGQIEEARQMLSDIYGSFTEGLDTADLKDAKALLDELGS